jgi:hypothetical protein
MKQSVQETPLTEMLPVTASEAAQQIADLNFHRGDAPQVPDIIKQVSDEHAVYIFNVGPKTWNQGMGGRGVFVIPACGEGKECSTGLKIGGIFSETIPVDMKKLEIRNEDGYAVALDIIGLGQGKSPANSLLRWGVFLSRTATPSTMELDKANRALDETAAKLVQEADDFYNAGPAEYKNITLDHRWAANRTNQKRAWMQPLVKMDVCPACQEPLKPGTVVHNCGAVLDWDKAIELGIKKAEDRPSLKKTA